MRHAEKVAIPAESTVRIAGFVFWSTARYAAAVYATHPKLASGIPFKSAQGEFRTAWQGALASAPQTIACSLFEVMRAVSMAPAEAKEAATTLMRQRQWAGSPLVRKTRESTWPLLYDYSLGEENFETLTLDTLLFFRLPSQAATDSGDSSSSFSFHIPCSLINSMSWSHASSLGIPRRTTSFPTYRSTLPGAPPT